MASTVPSIKGISSARLAFLKKVYCASPDTTKEVLELADMGHRAHYISYMSSLPLRELLLIKKPDVLKGMAKMFRAKDRAALFEVVQALRQQQDRAKHLLFEKFLGIDEAVVRLQGLTLRHLVAMGRRAVMEHLDQRKGSKPLGAVFDWLKTFRNFQPRVITKKSPGNTRVNTARRNSSTSKSVYRGASSPNFLSGRSSVVSSPPSSGTSTARNAPLRRSSSARSSHLVDDTKQADSDSDDSSSDDFSDALSPSIGGVDKGVGSPRTPLGQKLKHVQPDYEVPTAKQREQSLDEMLVSLMAPVSTRRKKKKHKSRRRRRRGSATTILVQPPEVTPSTEVVQAGSPDMPLDKARMDDARHSVLVNEAVARANKDAAPDDEMEDAKETDSPQSALTESIEAAVDYNQAMKYLIQRKHSPSHQVAAHVDHQDVEPSTTVGGDASSSDVMPSVSVLASSVAAPPPPTHTAPDAPKEATRSPQEATNRAADVARAGPAAYRHARAGSAPTAAALRRLRAPSVSPAGSLQSLNSPSVGHERTDSSAHEDEDDDTKQVAHIVLDSAPTLMRTLQDHQVVSKTKDAHPPEADATDVQIVLPETKHAEMGSGNVTPPTDVDVHYKAPADVSDTEIPAVVVPTEQKSHPLTPSAEDLRSSSPLSLASVRTSRSNPGRSKSGRRKSKSKSKKAPSASPKPAAAATAMTGSASSGSMESLAESPLVDVLAALGGDKTCCRCFRHCTWADCMALTDDQLKEMIPSMKVRSRFLRLRRALQAPGTATHLSQKDNVLARALHKVVLPAGRRLEIWERLDQSAVDRAAAALLSKQDFVALFSEKYADAMWEELRGDEESDVPSTDTSWQTVLTLAGVDIEEVSDQGWFARCRSSESFVACSEDQLESLLAGKVPLGQLRKLLALHRVLSNVNQLGASLSPVGSISPELSQLAPSGGRGSGLSSAASLASVPTSSVDSLSAANNAGANPQQDDDNRLRVQPPVTSSSSAPALSKRIIPDTPLDHGDAKEDEKQPSRVARVSTLSSFASAVHSSLSSEFAQSVTQADLLQLRADLEKSIMQQIRAMSGTTQASTSSEGLGGAGVAPAEDNGTLIGPRAPPIIAYPSGLESALGGVLRPVLPTNSGGEADHFLLSPASPSLPRGVNLNPHTGAVGGTALEECQVELVVTASNMHGSASAPVSVRVHPPQPSTSYPSAVKGMCGRPIKVVRPRNVGGAVREYHVNPPLPSGLRLHTQTGIVYGTPVQPCPSRSFRVTASNAGGECVCVLQVSIAATPPSSTRITASSPSTVSPMSPSPHASPAINSAAVSSAARTPPALHAGVPALLLEQKEHSQPHSGPASSRNTNEQTRAAIAIQSAFRTYLVQRRSTPRASTRPAISKGTSVVGAALRKSSRARIVKPLTSRSLSMPMGVGSTGHAAGSMTSRPQRSKSRRQVFTPRATDGSMNTTLLQQAVAEQWEHKAAMRIQALFRGHRTRQYLRALQSISYPRSKYELQQGSQVSLVPPAPHGPHSSSFRMAASSPLPPGLRLNAMSGEIAGTPRLVSPSSVYTVVVSNALASRHLKLKITVTPAKPQNPADMGSSAGTHSKWTVLYPEIIAYRGTPLRKIFPRVRGLSATELQSLKLCFNLVDPDLLPVGLHWDPATGAVSGTARFKSARRSLGVSVLGLDPQGTVLLRATVSVNVVVLDGAQGPESSDDDSDIEARVERRRSRSLTRSGAPFISYTSPVSAKVGKPIEPLVPSNAGGAADEFTEVTGGDYQPLPEGLSLDPQTGVISGSAVAACGIRRCGIIAVNAAGRSVAALDIHVDEKKPSIYYRRVAATIGQPFHAAPESYGGRVKTYCLSATSPVLPPGLDLDPLTGAISGVPTQRGEVTCVVKASNLSGVSRARVRIDVRVEQLSLRKGSEPVDASSSAGGKEPLSSSPGQRRRDHIPSRLDALRRLTDQQEIEQDDLLAITIHHSTDPEVAQEACKALARFLETVTDESKKPHSSSRLPSSAGKGSIQLVLDMMKYHKSNHKVLSAACKAVYTFAREPKHRALLTEIGGITSVMDAMRTHTFSTAVQQWGSAALVCLSCEDKGRENISDNGGLKVLLTALKNHMSSPAVMFGSIGALGYLAGGDFDTQKRLVDLGGIKAIIRVMQYHLKSAPIQRVGCVALCTLAAGDNQRYSQLIAEEQGIESILKAMTRHDQSPAVQQWALETLCYLAVSERVKREMRRQGVVQVARASKKSQHRLVREKAAALLTRLKTNSNSPKPLMKRIPLPVMMHYDRHSW